MSGAKPCARDCHTTVCISGPLTGGAWPLLVVSGGWDGRTVFNDVWLLEIREERGMWSEVRRVGGGGGVVGRVGGGRGCGGESGVCGVRWGEWGCVE